MQTIILSLIIKRIRVKALVKDKRAAMESFGTYVEVRNLLSQTSSMLFNLICIIFNSGLCLQSITGDPKDSSFLKKSLRGVRAIICPNV